MINKASLYSRYLRNNCILF